MNALLSYCLLCYSTVDENDDDADDDGCATALNAYEAKSTKETTS